MNAEEAIIVLTEIAAVDPRQRRTAPDLAVAGEMWADMLTDISLAEARVAVREFYAVESRSIMPADVLERVPVRASSWVGNVTEQRLAREARQVTS